MSYQGKYQPEYPRKYKGDPTNIVYRSLWERKFMKYCDENKNVLRWSSEEVKIPYRSPLDGKIHNYFMDFWMEVRQKSGKIETFLVEVKPFRQTQPPVIEEGKKMTISKAKQIKAYAVNVEKWKAAKNFCIEKGWKFVIMTEKQLFGKTT